MKLVDPLLILQRMSLGDQGNNLGAVQESVNAATDVIAGLLDTPLARATRVDTFNAPCVRSNLYQLGMVKLYLEQAFVDATQAIVFTVDGSASTEYTLDAERGVLTPYVVPNQTARNMTVAYTAGFAEDVTDGYVKDAPPWLMEAAVQEAVRIMFVNGQRFNQVDRRDRLADVVKTAQDILDNHHRPRVGHTFAQTSVVM